MRFNEKEIAFISSETGHKEGRLFYRGPGGGFREGCKERWFKLKGNLLFYFRLNEHGAVYENEPVGVIVVEQCRVQLEMYSELPNAFSITFANDLEKRHFFGSVNPKQSEEWLKCLKFCSYEHQKTKLKELQEAIMKKTGRDPLSAFSMPKTEACLVVEENDSDHYFHRVSPFSKPNGEFVSLI